MKKKFPEKVMENRSFRGSENWFSLYSYEHSRFQRGEDITIYKFEQQKQKTKEKNEITRFSFLN